MLWYQGNKAIYVLGYNENDLLLLRAISHVLQHYLLRQFSP